MALAPMGRVESLRWADRGFPPCVFHLVQHATRQLLAARTLRVRRASRPSCSWEVGRRDVRREWAKTQNGRRDAAHGGTITHRKPLLRCQGFVER